MRHKYRLPEDLVEADAKYASSSKTHEDALVKFMTEKKRQVSFAELRDSVGYQNGLCVDLGNLVAKGRIVRAGRGRYALKEYSDVRKHESMSKRDVLLDLIIKNQGLSFLDLKKLAREAVGRSFAQRLSDLRSDGEVLVADEKYYPCAK